MNKYFYLIWPLVLLVSRKIELLLNPRMWAEEATTHLQDSFGSNIWEILFFIPYNEGYMCLNRNITTIILRCLDISFAATVTTYIALLVQLLPHWIILGSNHSIWGTRFNRLILSSAIILIPIGTGETWLNTTCSHYHLGVLAFIILLDLQESISMKKLIGYVVILCLGALSSPITCFLFPSFILAKYLFNKNVSNFVIVPFFICCFIQFIISIINIGKSKGLGATRFEGFNFFEFPIILINDVGIKSITGEFGLKHFQTIVNALSKFLSLDHHHIYWIIFLFIILVTTLIIKNKKGVDKITKLMIFTFTSVFLLTYFSVSWNSTLLDRNALLPAVILVSLLFFILNNLKPFKALIIVSIYFVIAFYEFYKIDDIYYSGNWPTWEDEVEKWRLDAKYQPKVWPRNNKHWSFLGENDWRITITPDSE